MPWPEAAVPAQMRATARVSLAPLVESLPCLGAVTITLLEEPYIDLSLALIGGLDLMLLPGVRDAALYAAQTVRRHNRGIVKNGPSRKVKMQSPVRRAAAGVTRVHELA